jgi:hypothetical protein
VSQKHLALTRPRRIDAKLHSLFLSSLCFLGLMQGHEQQLNMARVQMSSLSGRGRRRQPPWFEFAYLDFNSHWARREPSPTCQSIMTHRTWNLVIGERPCNNGSRLSHLQHTTWSSQPPFDKPALPTGRCNKHSRQGVNVFLFVSAHFPILELLRLYCYCLCALKKGCGGTGFQHL